MSRTTSSTRPAVAIIGAGITGPSAALALALDGHQVTVYEQRAEDALHSNGIMGITPRIWDVLTSAGTDLASAELGRIYRDAELDQVAPSPFRLITWTDLHTAITRAAQDAGAHFEFSLPAPAPGRMYADTVVDAGGIVTAARRKIPSVYLGSVIYRGVSSLDTDEDFTTYKLAGKRGFLDIGHTRDGAAWAFGVRRPQPEHFRTTFTSEPPAEASDLPEPYRSVVLATPDMMVLPQAGWQAALSVHDGAWQHFTLGDANGPVRPITTSGANLAIQAGMSVTRLLAGDEALADDLLTRRAYAQDLGLRLTGPEIGGPVEDPNFDANVAATYGSMS